MFFAENPVISEISAVWSAVFNSTSSASYVAVTMKELKEMKTSSHAHPKKKTAESSECNCIIL